MARSKYGAKRTEQDGYKFDSLAEARRYNDLKLLQQVEEISGLTVHPRFLLWEAVIDGKRERIHYEGDFSYQEGGRLVVEDVKGVKTDVFRLKAKMFRAAYPDIDFRIVER